METEVSVRGRVQSNGEAVDDELLEEEKRRVMRLELFLTEKKVDDLYRSLARRLNLPYAAFLILTRLVREDGCEQKEIRDTFMLSKQTINSSLKKMEADGLLRIEDSGHRSTNVYLTDAGRKLLEGGVDQVYAAEKRAFDCLSDDEQEEMVRISGRLAESLSVELNALPRSE